MGASVVALGSVGTMVAARWGAARRAVDLILVAAVPYLVDPAP
jgi:hypothetical protein